MDNILMINNSKDAFGLTFMYLGLPINAESTEQVDKAVELLKAQKNVIQAYVADEIFDKMIGEEAAIAPYFNGDAVTMIQDNPDSRFLYPHGWQQHLYRLSLHSQGEPKEGTGGNVYQLYAGAGGRHGKYRCHRLFHPQYKGV